MGGQAKTGILRFLKELAEGLRAGTPLVSANPDADDAGRLSPQFRCLAKDPGRLLRAKVADRVEDPVERDPELALGTHPGRFHPVKERLELDPPPVVDNAHGNIHLGVHHSLSRQTLQHAIGDQFVVCGGAQPFADRFERQQEAGEIGVAIKRPGLGERQPLIIVPLAQFDQGLRGNGPLQVKMEFRFGKRPQPGGRDPA